METVYLYDGSFDGFLSCVFDSYVYHEEPLHFWDQDSREPTLFSTRDIPTDPAHAERVRIGLGRISPEALWLVIRGFLTCAPDREVILFRFIRRLMVRGRPLLRQLTDDTVFPLRKAVRHLEGEVHLLKGFVRFSDFEGLLAGEIRPKNRVLPLLRPHFCDRMYNETQYRRLWKRFYDTVEIRERHNPKLRRTHMPQRYWETMTEFQGEDYFRPAQPEVPGSAPLPGGSAGEEA